MTRIGDRSAAPLGRDDAGITPSSPGLDHHVHMVDELCTPGAGATIEINDQSKPSAD